MSSKHPPKELVPAQHGRIAEKTIIQVQSAFPSFSLRFRYPEIQPNRVVTGSEDMAKSKFAIAELPWHARRNRGEIAPSELRSAD